MYCVSVIYIVIFLIRWVGYDPEEHERVLEEYSKMEMVGDLMRFV